MRLSRNLCCGRSGAVRRVSGSPAELRERARVHFKSDDEEINDLERRLRVATDWPELASTRTGRYPSFFIFHPKSEAL